MKKNLLFALLFSTFSFLNSQNSIKNGLLPVETPKQIINYLALKKSKDNKLITFIEEKHKTTLAKELFELPKNISEIKVLKIVEPIK